MPKTILIADDEKDIRELVETILQLDGYNVLTACGGEETLDLLNLHRTDRPNAVLLDISMPRISGIDVCKSIKADPNFLDLPVAFLSARCQENEIKAGFDAGAAAFLVKPFSPSQLSDCVREMLKKNGNTSLS